MLWNALFGGGLVELVLNILALTILMGIVYVTITRGVQDGILRAAERQARRAQVKPPEEPASDEARDISSA